MTNYPSPPVVPRSPPSVSPPNVPGKLTLVERTPIASLINGYQRFRTSSYSVHEATYRTLGRGNQKPPVMVVACADSRCDPSVIFDSPPGELFVMRNVANLVPPYCPDGNFHGVSAALEYAVNVLEVQHLVIMGHGKCGGVCACLQGAELDENVSEFVKPWVGMLAAARDKVLKSGTINPQYALELEGIEVSIKNLMSFPFVKKRVESGELQIHGSWFAIEHGELHWRNATNGRFEVVPTEATPSSTPTKDMSRSNSISDLVGGLTKLGVGVGGSPTTICETCID